MYLLKHLIAPDSSKSLTTTSPRFGQVVASTVHQALTDPYFVPLEKLSRFLAEHPDRREITVDLLTKWAPDDLIPTCFVWNTSGGLQVDHPVSPLTIESIIQSVKIALSMDNPRGLIYIKRLSIADHSYWLGFLKVPIIGDEPEQVAGVYFDMDEYLSHHVPRLIDQVVNRDRFPLFRLQKTGRLMPGEVEGDIAIRIIRRNGEVYFQRGSNFDPESMIYAESQYYSDPVVCLQKDWDLQVFSSNPADNLHPDVIRRWGYWFIALSLLLVTLLYWWGIRSK